MLQKYFYDRYRIKKVDAYVAVLNRTYPGGKSSGSTNKGYADYVIDKDTGLFNVVGSIVDLSRVYTLSADRKSVTARQRGGYINAEYVYTMYEYIGRLVETDSPGEFDKTIVSVEGEYPDNSKHTDGYWYVKMDPLINKHLVLFEGDYKKYIYEEIIEPALKFNGASSRIKLKNTYSAANYTLEAWIKIEKYASGNGYVVTNVQNGGYGIYINAAGELRNNCYIGGAYRTAISSITIPLGEWVHVAGIYDGKQIKNYINGALVGSINQTGSITNTAPQLMTIGANPNVNESYDSYFNGHIKDVRIWNIARTDQQIKENMSELSESDRSGLRSWMKIDEGKGNSVVDSIDGLSSTIVNGQWDSFIAEIKQDWETVSQTLPTNSQFQASGMSDLFFLDRKTQAVLGTLQAAAIDSLSEGEVLKTTANLNKYTDLRKLEIR